MCIPWTDTFQTQLQFFTVSLLLASLSRSLTLAFAHSPDLALCGFQAIMNRSRSTYHMCQHMNGMVSCQSWHASFLLRKPCQPSLHKGTFLHCCKCQYLRGQGPPASVADCRCQYIRGHTPFDITLYNHSYAGCVDRAFWDDAKFVILQT